MLKTAVIAVSPVSAALCVLAFMLAPLYAAISLVTVVASAAAIHAIRAAARHGR